MKRLPIGTSIVDYFYIIYNHFINSLILISLLTNILSENSSSTMTNPFLKVASAIGSLVEFLLSPFSEVAAFRLHLTLGSLLAFACHPSVFRYIRKLDD